MLNRVTLVGRLTRDLELRNSVNGKPFVAFTMAVNSSFNDQVAFVPCFAWNKVAENMARYLKKGSLIALDGRIQTRTDNNNGQQMTVVQVVADSVSFLDSRNTNSTTNVDSIPTPNNVDFDNITFGENQQSLPNPQNDNDEPISFDGDDAILWD
ncbi:single-stranded DNA-binding protein [Spiroplasma mirum ATCC 29335]|uniref:Single-stranded DNA-binding protein n=1 Tax=Spiroplasma mirum ATCC 29335 TaxID=838561 RepID=W0GPN8_9MOLU|nr:MULTISPECIES: single-stranded DNA-binding protein [Spiroplasma]AHF60511.1 putative single-strand DNA-binding protein [Spiroplasma mirum ATCC 29335]AHI57350.1 single-stranded DNA-binding protein [Spiroplasma mirum ATCC 29335]AKM52634.1 single-strand DNA-binding protein [Spiroplasma atrichopogonis]